MTRKQAEAEARFVLKTVMKRHQYSIETFERMVSAIEEIVFRNSQ